MPRNHVRRLGKSDGRDGRDALHRFRKGGCFGGPVDGGSITVFVETGDASLDAFADRSVQLDERLLTELTSLDRATVSLASGLAVRVEYDGKIGAWPKFSEVD